MQIIIIFSTTIIFQSFYLWPLFVKHLPQCEKPSDQVSERHHRRRTQTIRNVDESVSGGQMGSHTIQMLRQQTKEERKRLLTDALGSELVLEIPEGQSLTMKEDVSLSWFALNKLRR